MKILLVGCGNLGKRYAEGIAKVNDLEEVHFYDISEKAEKEALYIFKDIREKNKLNLPLLVSQKSINKISPYYDVCIVSTTAFKRAILINDLNEKSKINNWIIERF